MKKYKSISLLLCLLPVVISSAVAQQQKIGYVNTDDILSNMPEYRGIQQQLETQSSEWDKQLAEIKEKIDQLKQDFAAKEILYTDELREQKQQEINQLVEQRQQFLDQKFGADGAYFQLQKELLEPLQRKVMQAVMAVAEREEFDFVFDRAQDANMLFGQQEWNLTDEVLQELGISLNNTSN